MTESNNNQHIQTLAQHILANRSTIRSTAQFFNKPKSTVHHDLSVKLKHINPPLYYEVKELLKTNFENKHIHGGESTKIKYQKIKNEINKNDELDYIK